MGGVAGAADLDVRIAPFMAETGRSIAGDRLAVAEPDSIEWKTGKFALAGTTILQTLEAERITEAHDVHAHIAREQHSSRAPQQRDLSRAMPRTVNHFDAASEGQ